MISVRVKAEAVHRTPLLGTIDDEAARRALVREQFMTAQRERVLARVDARLAALELPPPR